MQVLLVIFNAVYFYTYFVSCRKYHRKEGKLVLNPLDFVDLVINEKIRKTTSYETRPNLLPPENNEYIDELEGSTEYGDDESIKSRKIWSRWSKWSECSVTCGDGTITRRRLCVSGRCAPGEREEQRRPCTRSPCLYQPRTDFLVEELSGSK